MFLYIQALANRFSVHGHVKSVLQSIFSLLKSSGFQCFLLFSMFFVLVSFPANVYANEVTDILGAPLCKVKSILDFLRGPVVLICMLGAILFVGVTSIMKTDVKGLFVKGGILILILIVLQSAEVIIGFFSDADLGNAISC